MTASGGVGTPGLLRPPNSPAVVVDVRVAERIEPKDAGAFEVARLAGPALGSRRGNTVETVPPRTLLILSTAGS
jgi:hypothetical protein